MLALLLTRFGPLAMMVAILFIYTLGDFPITANLPAWYAGSGLFAVVVVLAAAGYGFYTSCLRGLPLFRVES